LVADDSLLRLETDGSLAQGYAATLDLLRLPDGPTALFAASGGLALGALRALYERAIRVPDAMSVVSFDDAYAPYVYPPVTSVTPSLELVAERAVELLVATLDRPDRDLPAPTHVVLPTRLVVRGSTTRSRLFSGSLAAS
jgi:DNA-binding LacI/PurR family transcriptional regulator